jgi:hypothetical protein
VTSDWLTTEDISVLRGCSRTTAWRWILRASTSPTRFAIEKTGKPLVRTTSRGFRIHRDLVEAFSGPPPDPRIAELVRRIGELEDAARLLEKRTEAHARALARLHAL